MKPEFQMDVRVNDNECDPYGRWRPSAILNKTQAVADVHSEKMGYARDNLLKNDMCWVLYRLSVRMHAYPSGTDIVRVTTWPAPIAGPVFPRYFTMESPDGSKIGEIVAGYILMSVSTRRPLRPSALDTAIETNDRPAPMPLPSALHLDGAQQIGSRPVRYSDLDLNGHMNNTRYIDWVCDAVGTDALRPGLAGWQVNYISEARPDELLTLRAKTEGSTTLIIGKRAENGKTVFESSVTLQG